MILLHAFLAIIKNACYLSMLLLLLLLLEALSCMFHAINLYAFIALRQSQSQSYLISSPLFHHHSNKVI